MRRIGWSWVALVLLLAGRGGAEPGDEPGGPRERREEARAKSESLARLQQGLKAENIATQAYDAKFYGLDLDLDPVAKWLVGSVTMQARVVGGSLSSVDLDLDAAMQVDSAWAGGVPVSFTHNDGTLSVALDHAYADGEAFGVRVHYAGLPNSAMRNFVFDSHNNEPLIWTLSEPFGARMWWPCKDTPADKADSVAIALTVPSNLIAVSEGKLEGTSSPQPGKTTYRWRERYPIATYLVSIAAFPYAVQTVTYTPSTGGTMPLSVWSYPEQSSFALPIANLTLGILQRYSALFGEYPFSQEKYGYAQFNFGGGMEHQTATSVIGWSTVLASHETAHQWFGDAITCESFSHVWLNEGFATYCEALWDEANGGGAAYQANIWDNRYYGPGTIFVPPQSATAFGRIFDVNLSYNKASWVLHMLRGMFGDATFFDILRTYQADARFKYGTATTEGFQSVAESVTGRNLSNFFGNWIYEPYFPSYLYDWSSTPSGGGWSVQLGIEQLQAQPLYNLPIRVRVTTTAGDQDFVAQDSLALQSFTLQTGAQPLAVELDPDEWILHTAEQAIHAPSFSGGILVVNGVNWTGAGAEITAAYSDSLFCGRYPFAFWDYFNAPGGGYVPQLPPPIGHGPVPPQVLGQYSTVVWVGDNFGGDLDGWGNAAIVSYLRQGGNVLLLGRRGQEFLTPSRSSYLGLRWAESPVSTLGAATPALPSLVAMGPIKAQTQCAVFETGFDAAETQLLLSDTQSFSTPRGIAAWRRPAAGGSVRASGGHFAFVSGRPYRWEHAPLRANVHTILSTLFGEGHQTSDTPVLATLESAQETGGIRLRWQRTVRAPVVTMQLWRSAGGDAARQLATWPADASSGEWLDRDVGYGERYIYELRADTPHGPERVATLEVARTGGAPPARVTRLLPVAPNPFNPGVTVRFELARAGRVTLRIFDAHGRLVRRLLDADRPAAPASASWDGRDGAGRAAPSGLYVIELRTGGERRSVKAVLAR